MPKPKSPRRQAAVARAPRGRKGQFLPRRSAPQGDPLADLKTRYVGHQVIINATGTAFKVKDVIPPDLLVPVGGGKPVPIRNVRIVP